MFCCSELSTWTFIEWLEYYLDNVPLWGPKLHNDITFEEKRTMQRVAFRIAMQTFIHLNTITYTLAKQILGKAAVRSRCKGIVGKGIRPAAVVSCLGWRQQFLSSLTFCFLFLYSTPPQKWHAISSSLTSMISFSSDPSYLDQFHL